MAALMPSAPSAKEKDEGAGGSSREGSLKEDDASGRERRPADSAAREDFTDVPI